MGKAVMLKDDTYYLLKAYAGNRGDTLSGMVEKAIRFAIDTGSDMESKPEIVEMYNRAFGENTKSEIQAFKDRLNNFVASL